MSFLSLAILFNMTTLDEIFIYYVDIQTKMTYTEIQERNSTKYYYRVKSIKIKGKVSKERVYLGKDINKDKLKKKEIKADKKLNKSLSVLLTDEELEQLKDLKKKFRASPNTTFNNRYEAFVSKFTYDSNAIEGNTITLQETSYLLFENRTPPGKSMREINEVGYNSCFCGFF